MIAAPRSVALSAAVLIGLSGIAMPVSHAQPVAGETAHVFTTSEFGGDKSRECTLHWEAAGDLPSGDNMKHLSKVYNPYEGVERTSAGALEVHGWSRNVRVPVATAFPVEEGAVLTVTLPEGAGENTVLFRESADNWIIDRYYGAPYRKGSFGEYFSDPSWGGNTATFTVTQRIPKNTAFDLRFTAAGEELVGETRVTFTGRWEPLQVALARDGENGHAVPDCFRPATEVLDGNHTDRCEVEWVADAVLDRRFLDWVNNGFIHKIKSPHQTEAPAEADAPGSMEVQHYFTGNDTLWLRIPVGTDSAVGGARLVVDLPEIEGREWEVQPTGAPFYPVRDYDAADPLPTGEIVGDQAIYEIGDFEAGTAFTALITMRITPEEFDTLTAPDEEGQWSDLFHPTATLTGEYAEGDENCVAPAEPKPGGSAPLAGSALLAGLAGSALLSSGGPGSSTVAPETPAGTPAPEAPAEGPVSVPDPKVQAQQQALNARPVVNAAPQAAPAKESTTPVRQVAQQQSQLAETGVSGVLTAVVVGLLAVGLGAATLMLRRRR